MSVTGVEGEAESSSEIVVERRTAVSLGAGGGESGSDEGTATGAIVPPRRANLPAIMDRNIVDGEQSPR
jgi:hypothetical protein